MKLLHDEVIRRFPEVRESLYGGDDEDLPYVLMYLVAKWLKELRPSDLTPELIGRVVDFGEWCEDQPRGQKAGDDLLTIWVVGFLEELFDSEVTRRLIPHLVPKEDLLENAEYWRKWVGAEDYELALATYEEPNDPAAGSQETEP